MKTVPIQIRNDAVVRSIRELSDLTGQPITEAVARAVEAQLERQRRLNTIERERKHQEIKKIVREFNCLPAVGPRLTDDDLYDEDGFPK